MNSNEITRRIWELLHAGPHPDAEQPADETLPIIWADSDPDAWHLSVYPGDKMDPKDREFIWQEFARAVDAVMPAHLPEGVNVVVHPPHTFPDGLAVDGVVLYTYPPPPSVEAAAHWWGIMSGLLPEVSRIAQHRISSQWHEFQAEKLRRMTPAERHAHRMRARLDAIEAARERNRPDYTPPPRRAASPPAREKRKGPRI
jgi:hypothetical protein